MSGGRPGRDGVLRRRFTQEVECLVRPPREPGTGAPPLVVLLHGQGQSGARHERWMGAAVPPGFAAAFPDGFHGMEQRQPGKPVRVGRAWYLYSTEDRPAFLASLDVAVDALWATIGEAIAALGADPGQVWLGGFSQGAYLAQVAALRRPGDVRGWIAQAGGLREDYIPGGLPDLAGRAVLLQHGTADRSIPPETAERAATLLRQRGADVTLEFVDADHRITPAMAASARAWLERQPRG